jgi:hypothetical protein
MFFTDTVTVPAIGGALNITGFTVKNNVSTEISVKKPGAGIPVKKARSSKKRYAH